MTRSSRFLCGTSLFFASASFFACGGGDSTTGGPGVDAGEDGNTQDSTAPSDAEPGRDAGGGSSPDSGPGMEADGGPDASEVSDTGPVDGESVLDGQSLADGGKDGEVAEPDASDAGPVDGESVLDGESPLADGGKDGGVAEPDASDAAVPIPDPCATPPSIVVVDGGMGPSLAWCHSFTYPADPAGYFDVNVGFAADGTTTLYGAATEATTIAGTALPARAPFSVRFDGSGNPTSALSLPSGIGPDAGAGSWRAIRGTLGTSGDFAFVGELLGAAGFLWTYGGSGAPVAVDTFVSSIGNVETRVAAIAPLANGDFAVAGWFSDGTDFGTGPLPSPVNWGDLFVARFTASGACAWATSLGADSYEDSFAGLAVDASGNLWVQTFGAVPDGGGGQSYLAARYDATTGSPIGGTISLSSDGDGTGIGTAAIANGDGLTLATGGAILRLNSGADAGSQFTTEAVLGLEATEITAIAPDGAGGAIVTGTTLGGSFGAIALPRTGPAEACFVAHVDAAWNVTWATYCSALTYSVGTSVAVSGKTLVVSGTVALGLAAPDYLEPLVGLPGTQPAADTPAQVFVQEYTLP